MSHIINIGVVAHVDAGKTTLTEQLLYESGAVRSAGSVDAGTAHTDFLEQERARGITIRAATAVLRRDGVDVNLIDTPGHVDFTAEVERSLRVLDLAVLVVSAVEGVQSQTEIIIAALDKLRIPAVIFINKCDRIGADADAVIAQLGEKFGMQAVDAASLFDGRPGDALLEAVAQCDDAVLESYLDNKPIPREVLVCAFTAAAMSRRLFPALRGVALRGEGTKQVLDLIALLGAARPEPAHSDEFSALVFRVEHEKAMGRVAHARLYGGALRNRDMVRNATRGSEDKLVQIRKVSGDRAYDVGEVGAGDIAVLCGLPDVRTGDVLGSAAGIPGQLSIAHPLLNVSVIPQSEADWPRIVEAFEQLAAEEPLLDAQWEASTRQLIVSITGLIQLEFLTDILRSRFGLTLSFSKPRIIYKETPSGAGHGFDAYTMPKPCWAILDFLIEPGPRGSGIEYHSIIGENKILYRYQAQVEQALPDALRQGPLGWQVTDAKITLVDGQHHHVHTHPLDFIVTTPMALMRGLCDIGTTLLEPVQACRIGAPEEFAGKLISQIIAMRGEFDSPVIRNGAVTIDSRIPAATSLEFPIWLASATSGKGTLSVAFDSYRPCPVELGETTPYRGINPIDRAKYILYVRGAIQ